MGRLPCPSDGDITDTDQGNGIRLLLEYTLVEEKVAQTYPQTVEPGERIEERIITFLHYTEVRRGRARARKASALPVISRMYIRRADVRGSPYSDSLRGRTHGSSSLRLS